MLPSKFSWNIFGSPTFQSGALLDIEFWVGSSFLGWYLNMLYHFLYILQSCWWENHSLLNYSSSTQVYDRTWTSKICLHFAICFHLPTTYVNMDLFGFVFTEFLESVSYFSLCMCENLLARISVNMIGYHLFLLSLWYSHDINIRYFPDCCESLWDFISASHFPLGLPSVDLVSNL